MKTTVQFFHVSLLHDNTWKHLLSWKGVAGGSEQENFGMIQPAEVSFVLTNAKWAWTKNKQKKPPFKLLLKLDICVQHPGECKEDSVPTQSLCYSVLAPARYQSPGCHPGCHTLRAVTESSQSLPSGAGALLSACAFVVLNNETWPWLSSWSACAIANNALPPHITNLK